VTSLSRKIKRKNSLKMAKYLKKSMSKITDQAVQDKIKGIMKVPDKCSACEKVFNKLDRKQVFSWMLRISEDKDTYDLFCPPCFEKYFSDNDESGGGEQ